MDETAWLASEDPAAMLGWLHGQDWTDASHEWHLRASDRRLLLWVEANRCGACESAWHGMGWSWTAKAAYLAGASCSTPQRKAALLREIVGNPFRPACAGVVWREKKDGEHTGREYWVNPRWLAWNDGLVPRLAQAAYAERGRRCEWCQGKGFVWDTMWHPCVPCVGKGVIDDGTLDPERLLVLADALEESGCEEEELLRHLRGEERCFADRCVRGRFNHRVFGTHSPCLTCRGSGWVSSRGPHVHGCWALDLLLGLDD